MNYTQFGNVFIVDLSLNRQRGLTENQIAQLPIVKLTDAQLKFNKSCTICLDDFQLNDEAQILSCFHFFHSPCISQWLKDKNACPICRTQVDLNDHQQAPSGHNDNADVVNLDDDDDDARFIEQLIAEGILSGNIAVAPTEGRMRPAAENNQNQQIAILIPGRRLRNQAANVEPSVSTLRNLVRVRQSQVASSFIIHRHPPRPIITRSQTGGAQPAIPSRQRAAATIARRRLLRSNAMTTAHRLPNNSPLHARQADRAALEPRVILTRPLRSRLHRRMAAQQAQQNRQLPQ